MSESILLVDDEPNVLAGYRRQLHQRFPIQTACGPEAALELIQGNEPFAVIISDMRMPGMDGVTLLKRVQERSPDTVRMMLTGNADQDTAVKAVNEGHVFRFLNKPCGPEILCGAITAGIDQYRLITAERTLLTRTLGGAVQMLTEVLELAAPEVFGCGQRIRSQVREVAARMDLADRSQLELAALFAPAGFVTLPPDVLRRYQQGAALPDHEQGMIEGAYRVSGKLVGHIPRLERVSAVLTVLSMSPQGVPADADPWIVSSAALLRLVLDYDRMTQQGQSPQVVIGSLRRASVHPAEALDALAQCVGSVRPMIRKRVDLVELQNGMVLDEDLRSVRGQLLVAKGHEVTLAMRERLVNYKRSGQVATEVEVLVPE